LGITTLGQLAGADVQDLAMRFGKNGAWMWKVANGLDDEPVTPRGDHVSISAESTLDNFTRDREIIRVLLHELAGEIHERVLEYGYSFRTIGVKLVRADFSLETREITYPEPMSERVRIDSAIAPLLDKFELSDGKQAVRKAGLKLSHIARKDPSIKGAPAKKTPDLPVQKTLLDY
jgi:DNA polymerase IV (DinB-like DNA polymerase)